MPGTRGVRDAGQVCRVHEASGTPAKFAGYTKGDTAFAFARHARSKMRVISVLAPRARSKMRVISVLARHARGKMRVISVLVRHARGKMRVIGELPPANTLVTRNLQPIWL